MTENDIPPCMIYIDKEGKWFHEGSEMIHREIIRHFYRHMEIDSSGLYIISWRGERCYVEVEDTPFIVRRAVSEKDDQIGFTRVVLYLSDDEKEDLSPETLHVGKDNVIYCMVKNGTFPARFTRAAYYQLAECIEEEGGMYYLTLKGKRYFI